MKNANGKFPARRTNKKLPVEGSFFIGVIKIRVSKRHRCRFDPQFAGRREYAGSEAGKQGRRPKTFFFSF